MPLVLAWARAFAVTTLVELLVATPLLANVEARRWRRAAVVVFAQIASHPAVWFILPELGMQRSTYLVVAEGWAVVCELLLYRVVFPDLRWSRAFGVSALANGASFAAGLVLQHLHVI